jgi:hypothetical protein
LMIARCQFFYDVNKRMGRFISKRHFNRRALTSSSARLGSKHWPA